MATKFSPRMRAFLAAFEETGQVTAAAEAAGIRRDLHYRALTSNPAYKAAYDEAERRFGDELEGHARKLAREGVTEETKWGPRTRYSAALIVALLKASKPEKYRDRVEHEVGPNLGRRFEGSMQELLDLYRGLTEEAAE